MVNGKYLGLKGNQWPQSSNSESHAKWGEGMDRQGPYMRSSVAFGKILAFRLRALRRHQRASAVGQ